jgi:hypothetical protein
MELYAGAAGLGDATHPGKVSATSAAHAVDDCWGEAWQTLGEAAVEGTLAFVESTVTSMHEKHARPTSRTSTTAERNSTRFLPHATPAASFQNRA